MEVLHGVIPLGSQDQRSSDLTCLCKARRTQTMSLTQTFEQSARNVVLSYTCLAPDSRPMRSWSVKEIV